MCLFWVVISAIKVIYDFLMSQIMTRQDYQYDLLTDIYTSLVAVVLAGFLGATTIVFLLKNIYKYFPLWQALLISAISITTIIIVVSFPAAMFYTSSIENLPFLHEETISSAFAFYLRPDFLLVLLIWVSVSMLSLIFLQVNDRYGHGVLLEVLAGKYYRPRREKRIFMFLDMKSSTSIAETLGDIQYFRLLNDLYSQLNDIITEHYGEIYQYVGDEIVVTWRLNSGVKKARCVECFFQVEEILARLSNEYYSSYGYRPEFKAAIHCGVVTAGEVGTVKKDIIYTGDVLNTTSRILECCNQFKVKLIISGHLLDLLDLPVRYKATDLGTFKFRGKQKEVPISTIMHNENRVKQKHRSMWRKVARKIKTR